MSLIPIDREWEEVLEIRSAPQSENTSLAAKKSKTRREKQAEAVTYQGWETKGARRRNGGATGARAQAFQNRSTTGPVNGTA